MTQKLIAQGAEAKIILNTSHWDCGGENFIIKDRIKKSYRIPELDDKIRKRRTKAESKLLKKASEVINTPIPIEKSKNFHKIKMPFIEGKKLSIHLDKFQIAKQKQIAKKIGEEIAKLHDIDIIHGDLTTSNMILVEDKKENFALKNLRAAKGASVTGIHAGRAGSAKFSQQKIFFVDFGLGYFNGKYEDKAVDLHLLKQALEAKHFKYWKELWKAVEAGYKRSKDSEKVLERLSAVEKRGRYKH